MSTMPSLPTTRQRTHPDAREAKSRAAARENLTRAFLTFTQAAGSLEKSYSQLQSEVSRLHQELQRANCELERSLEENSRVRGFLARVLESLPCGVIVTGEQGKPQVVNPQARSLLQFPPDWSLENGAGLPEHVAAWVGNRGPAPASSELELPVAGDPAHRTIGILRADISGSAGESRDSVWIVRDLTDEKRLAADREAARRSVALAEVATVLAHEIRNPLGSMELFTGLLADSTAHLPETRQWITHLQAGLRGLSATVNNVLQFHGQPAPQMLLLDLHRLLAETVDFLLPLARQRGQSVSFENGIGQISCRVDGNRLKQVFFNLALNAFRAMPPGCELHVSLRWAPQFPGGLAQIDFRDEGRGIPAELLERIFDPGFTTTPGSPGLGLAVCRKIVEQHGGEIRVQSKPRHGATFTLFLPVSGAGE